MGNCRGVTSGAREDTGSNSSGRSSTREGVSSSMMSIVNEYLESASNSTGGDTQQQRLLSSPGSKRRAKRLLRKLVRF